MMKAIPKDEWVVFQAATTTEFAEVMKVWARSVPLEEYASNPQAKETKAEEAERREDKTCLDFRILKAGKYVQLNTLRGLGTEAHVPRVVVAGERESVASVQPAMIEVTSLGRLAEPDHPTSPFTLSRNY